MLLFCKETGTFCNMYFGLMFFWEFKILDSLFFCIFAAEKSC